MPSVDDMQPRILYLKNSVQDIYQGYYLIINDDGTKSIGQIGGRSYEGKDGITVDSETAEISNDLVTSGGDIGGNVNVKGTAEIQSDLTVNGNIYQKGEAYKTHAEQFYTKKDVIITRDNAESPLVDDEFSGFIAKHYDADGNDGIAGIFNDGTLRIGDKNDLQAVATRLEDFELQDGMLFKWNAEKKCLETIKSLEELLSKEDFNTLSVKEDGLYVDPNDTSLIDDTNLSNKTSYSSNKVNTLLSSKQDKLNSIVTGSISGSTLYLTIH